MKTSLEKYYIIAIAFTFGSHFYANAETPLVEYGLENEITLEEIASSQMQWTGVAVSAEERIFANFPRWSPAVVESVVEIMPDGEVKPYPNEDINAWSKGVNPTDVFVCVQSVYCDNSGYLWVLDTGNPMFAGVQSGGAKLIQIDLSTDEIVGKYVFDSEITPANSYLNDVRVDDELGYVYVTDSGIGALVLLDLRTGEARRVLEGHYSTQAEDLAITVGGVTMAFPDGTPIQIHSDGIALNPTRDYLYYQALTGRTLYRIPTEDLCNVELSGEDLGEKVEKVTESGAADGIMFDSWGNLYLSALEDNAIKRLTADGVIETLVVDERISWPDSFAIGPDGSVYFTTSRIHEGPAPQDDYKIYKLSNE
jgi:sugar lactone lactonase YvrE